MEANTQHTTDANIRKTNIERSAKLHATGFLVGAAVAIEEDRSIADILRYGIAGFLSTLFFETAYPRTVNKVKEVIF